MWKSVPLVLVALLGSIHGRRLVNPELENVDWSHIPDDPSWAQGKSIFIGTKAAAVACNGIFSCADCKTAQICRPAVNGSLTPVKQVVCPTTRPYCDPNTGSCVSTPADTCGEADPFICLQDGYFPDPSNCTIYHVCDNLVAHKFQCIIPGETYNADAKSCEPSTVCNAFSCAAPGSKVVHSNHPNFFAYCDNSAKPNPVVVDRCVASTQLNVTSQLCEPVCVEEGVIQDPEDCTKYYKCHYIWIDINTKYMIKDRMDCPANTGFDPSNYICVALTNFPSCKPKQMLL